METFTISIEKGAKKSSQFWNLFSRNCTETISNPLMNFFKTQGYKRVAISCNSKLQQVRSKNGNIPAGFDIKIVASKRNGPSLRKYL